MRRQRSHWAHRRAKTPVVILYRFLTACNDTFATHIHASTCCYVTHIPGPLKLNSIRLFLASKTRESAIQWTCMLRFSLQTGNELEDGHSIDWYTRRPLNRVKYVFFSFCDPMWPWPLIFWPNVTLDSWWAIHLAGCGKFGDCSFNRFASIVRTARQTHTKAHR